MPYSTDLTDPQLDTTAGSTAGLTAPAAVARRRSRRPLLLLVASLVAMVVLGACTPEQNESSRLVNDARGAYGIPGLMMHGQMNDKAQAWAEHMAAEGRISHSDLTAGAPDGWTLLGENVGVGYSLQQIQDAYMNSPAHRANILDRRFTHVGYGVAYGADGRIYSVQYFMRA
ncbi:MAG TPA: CAP domain-containing protein [Acidimicrobiales bacterium]|nr:CAP domain-containing protein [Acidimicrobiales bacterium]